MDNSTGIINFDTPYAYLDPEQAYQTSVSEYLQVAALGALVWDIVDNLPFDIKLLFTNRPTLSAFTYFGSRVGTLGYVLSASIFHGAATGNCAVFEKVDDAFYPISIGFSSLLFFLRLRAIYNNDRVVVTFFFILWCGLVVSTIFLPIDLLGGNIGPTAYCTDLNIPASSYAAVTAPLVNDTLVFIAITWRLAHCAHLEGSLLDNVKIAVSGKYLPIFTKSLLLDGQRYYLISLVSNLVTVVIGFIPTLPVEIRTMCVTPNVALVGIMACRVYRRTRTGAFKEAEISTMALTNKQNKIVFAPVAGSQTNASYPGFATTEVGPMPSHHNSNAEQSYQQRDGNIVSSFEARKHSKPLVDEEKGV